ncbi:oxidation resistance protein 1-like [Phoenix dactylifera]|uniref:Oxidation resistance protein 1 n=1 Tax=Phoenix dactylifera TaxID=42345 RepID=A0A8B7BTQ4_PHODC|nr:oxidation resistance protein 1 [Phoenix dactylifera]XP_008785159.1 oxidation resistance protein 1 [Phoenix dactylifera]XP_038982335.1 oxidation resistance protein 1-like [Phoenix dactylifera]
MLSLREKVADKLYRLLADSPSSPSPPTADSPIARDESQAVSFSSEEFTTSKTSTFSSYILSLLPTRSDIDAEKPNSPARRHSRRTLSSCLLPAPLDCSEDSRNESDETVEILKEKLDHVSERNINRSNGTEEASTSHDSGEYVSYLSEKSAFISADLFEFLQSSLPNIVKGCQWVLLYSTWRHGISLHTLLRRSVNLPGPCLLIAGDMKGAIFGGLLDSPLKPTAKRKYQGTNQTFVFTTIYGEPRLFRATGSNRYYYLCLNDLLAFGGGGNFALRLDEDLLHGMSGPCETFGNLCLAHSEEFELKNVELWGFAHLSQYRT